MLILKYGILSDLMKYVMSLAVTSRYVIDTDDVFMLLWDKTLMRKKIPENGVLALLTLKVSFLFHFREIYLIGNLNYFRIFTV